MPAGDPAKALHVCNAWGRLEGSRAAKRPQLLVTPHPAVQYGENLHEVQEDMGADGRNHRTAWRGEHNKITYSRRAPPTYRRTSSEENTTDKVSSLLAKLPWAEY